jgi:branched-chain amino acid transport system substrate-binding protein
MLIVACSSGAASPSGAAVPSATAAPTSATSEPSVTGEPIRIGVIEPFSGFAAAYGKYAMDSINLALKDHGDTVNGRKIELIQGDEQCDPTAAVNAVNAVIGKVVATIGPECSGSALAAEPILAEAKIPHLLPGFMPALTEQGDEWAFRISTSDAAQMQVLAAYIKELGFTKLALANDTTPFASGEAQAFVDAWKALDMPDIVVNVTFEFSATDFSGQIQRVRQSDVEAIVITAYEDPSGLFLKQARQLGLEHQVFGGLDFGDDIFTAAAGESAEGSIFVCNFLDVDPNAKPYADRFIAEYGYSMGEEIQGYFGMTVLLDALSRAGPDFTQEQLRDAIRSTDLDTPLGHASYDDKGELREQIVYIGEYKNLERTPIKRVVVGTP